MNMGTTRRFANKHAAQVVVPSSNCVKVRNLHEKLNLKSDCGLNLNLNQNFESAAGAHVNPIGFKFYAQGRSEFAIEFSMCCFCIGILI